MANSILTTGFAIGDKCTTTGTAQIYIASYTNNVVYTTGTNSMITSATGLTASGMFKTFDVDTEDIVLDTNPTVSTENNNIFHSHVLSVKLSDYSQETNNLAHLLAIGRWRIIVKYNSGKYGLIGYERPAKATALTISPGKGNNGDAFGSNITFTANSALPIQEIDATFARTLIA